MAGNAVLTHPLEGGYFQADLSKLALFLHGHTSHDDVSGAGLAWKNGKCDLIVRPGPEGRQLNVSPARKGWDTDGR
jgi:hypothetical protein